MTTEAWTQAIERALIERDLDAAWAHLEPFRDQLETDSDIALAWVSWLQASPSRSNAHEDAHRVLARFGEQDPELAAAALTVWIRLDERRPLDEPPLSDAPARHAADAAARLLDHHVDRPETGALRIAYANALRRLGRAAEAQAEFERAIADASRGGDGAPGEWLSDFGMLHKGQRRFRPALTCFEKAIERLGEQRGLLFNLAIAAVGAGEMEKAAAALHKLGFQVEGGPNRFPSVEQLPPVQVRIPTRGAGHQLLTELVPDEAAMLERVWVQPLSPVHGALVSPTFREGLADWGDVVLFDVAPAAFIEDEGRRVPVFPLLTVLKKGDEARFRFLALEQEPGQVRRIGEALPEGVVLYEHGVRVERICARCAAGDVLTKHEHEAPSEHRGVYGKLLVPAGVPLAEARKALEAAQQAQPGVLMAMPGLYEALSDTPRAGKAHKTWGVIERGVMRQKS